MADLQDRVYSSDNNLGGRNCAACVMAANFIAGEPLSTPGNTERVQLAKYVLNPGPTQGQWVAVILAAVEATVADPATLRPAIDGGIGTPAASDAILEAQISAVWNAVAGVPGPP